MRSQARASISGHFKQNIRQNRTKIKIHSGIIGSNLVEAVVGVLQDVAGVVAELLANGDEVHGDQQRGEGEEPEGALPPDGLQRRNVVLGHELLLVDHLRGHDDLRPHDEDVAEQDV